MMSWVKATNKLWFMKGHKTIGYITEAISKDPSFDWSISVLCKDLYPIETSGSCKTLRGAKKAIDRNWSKFLDLYNLKEA